MNHFPACSFANTFDGVEVKPLIGKQVAVIVHENDCPVSNLYVGT